MKKITLLSFIALISVSSFCQDDAYLKAMATNIDLLGRAAGPEDYLKCAAKFERIAVAERTLWIPYYYGSYSLILLSFDEPDGTRKDQLLDRAQQYLDRALELAPDESELYVLQAFLYPSRIMVDPVARGMEYIEKCFSSLEKAKELNPENPRAYFLEAMNKLNMPPSFGGGPEVAKPIFEEADAKFKAFSSEDPLWPRWGEEPNRAELAKLQ